MTEIVTATVVEVPKPERPTLYVAIGDLIRDTGEREWCSCVGEDVETAKEMLSWGGDSVRLECVATVPGSASPPAVDARLCPDCKTEPRLFNRPYCRSCEGKHEAAAVDAIVELCVDDCHIVTEKIGDDYWRVARYDRFGEACGDGYGPDPQSAARACLEAIKAESGKAGG